MRKVFFYLVQVSGFQCAKCEKSYKSKPNLYRHIRLECGVNRRYTCVHCNMGFKHNHHLRRHIGRAHVPFNKICERNASHI